MGSKQDCVCCGKRLSSSGKRPVIMKSLLMFVSARLFPSQISDDSFICNTCRWMYNKWATQFDFLKILSEIDGLNKDDNRTIEENDGVSNRSVASESNMTSNDQYVG